jgi:hypothetical protein
MRIARHQNILVDLGQSQQRRLQGAQALADFRRLRLHIKPQIERDLIVPAARRVQLRPRRADAFGQRGLDIHVDVFERTFPAEIARLDFSFDHREGRLDLFVLFSRQNASRGERLRVRQRTFDVVGIKPPIDRDRLAVELGRLARGLIESSPAHALISPAGHASRSRKRIRRRAGCISAARS